MEIHLVSHRHCVIVFIVIRVICLLFLFYFILFVRVCVIRFSQVALKSQRNAMGNGFSEQVLRSSQPRHDTKFIFFFFSFLFLISIICFFFYFFSLFLFFLFFTNRRFRPFPNVTPRFMTSNHEPTLLIINIPSNHHYH